MMTICNRNKIMNCIQHLGLLSMPRTDFLVMPNLNGFSVQFVYGFEGEETNVYCETNRNGTFCVHDADVSLDEIIDAPKADYLLRCIDIDLYHDLEKILLESFDNAYTLKYSVPLFRVALACYFKCTFTDIELKDDEIIYKTDIPGLSFKVSITETTEECGSKILQNDNFVLTLVFNNFEGDVEKWIGEKCQDQYINEYFDIVNYIKE